LPPSENDHKLRHRAGAGKIHPCSGREFEKNIAGFPSIINKEREKSKKSAMLESIALMKRERLSFLP
jgi:hypothetical protein